MPVTIILKPGDKLDACLVAKVFAKTLHGSAHVHHGASILQQIQPRRRSASGGQRHSNPLQATLRSVSPCGPAAFQRVKLLPPGGCCTRSAALRSPQRMRSPEQFGHLGFGFGHFAALLQLRLQQCEGLTSADSCLHPPPEESEP